MIPENVRQAMITTTRRCRPVAPLLMAYHDDTHTVEAVICVIPSSRSQVVPAEAEAAFATQIPHVLKKTSTPPQFLALASYVTLASPGLTPCVNNAQVMLTISSVDSREVEFLVATTCPSKCCLGDFIPAPQPYQTMPRMLKMVLEQMALVRAANCRPAEQPYKFSSN